MDTKETNLTQTLLPRDHRVFAKVNSFWWNEIAEQDCKMRLWDKIEKQDLRNDGTLWSSYLCMLVTWDWVLT